jgi:hypothetical protein
MTIAILTAGCRDAQKADGSEQQIATLYRNGSLRKDFRLHVASFDVTGEANDYNINNCQMTARLLNSNVARQWTGKGLPDVGVWCEPGPFREDGSVPENFVAEFPTGILSKAAP